MAAHVDGSPTSGTRRDVTGRFVSRLALALPMVAIFV
jgi:hypothetical protein